LKASTTAIVFIAFLSISLKSNGQFYKDMSAGLNGGIYVYQGDLTPKIIGSFRTMQPGFSLFVKKPINHFLSARIHFSMAKLKGDDSRYSKPEYRQQRNFYFTTPVKEFSAQIVWNVLGKNYEDQGIMPYVFSGAGVSLIGVKKDYSRMDPKIFGQTSDVVAGLVIDNIHGTPRTLLSVPVGVGAEYPISNRFSVNIEASYRFIFTDYLDGFSQSANPKQQDHYHSTSAGIIYKFGNRDKGIGCPVVKF
jgi:opacity protein-like surface antigen